MTIITGINDWIQTNSTLILLVFTILVLIYFIIGLIQAIRKRPTIGLITVILLILGLLFAAFLISRARELESADWAQVILTIGLIAITASYAASATTQANASVKMAEEMREQTKTLREIVSMSIRPAVSIEVLQVKGGKTYPFEPPAELYTELQNTGKGPARNVVVTCEAQAKKVEYTKFELSSLNVGDKQRFSIHRTPAISADKVRVAYVILKAIYNDELGEGWVVTLEIDKDGKSWKPGEIITERLFGRQHD